ncbi:MAG: BatA domain-containing protein [Planctomycetaceae bacterium]
MMSFFLNPLLLTGLLGVALPVIAHLLSRRKYDVVPWGAMQFLNPSRKTRRRMRLEELLLLLVRMSMIALVALALSRPWIRSGFLMGYQSAGSRDVVLVIDGSNSMGRSDGLTSVHDKAVRRAKDFLETLRPGDTVAVIDARDTPVRLMNSPLQDLTAVRQILDEIPPPAGAGNLQRACEEAVAILGRCSNGAREVVVLTDRQRAGWSVANAASWKRFDDVLNFPAVRPHVWVVDLSSGLGSIRQNVSVGQVDVSRDLTVPGFPISVQVPIRNAGAAAVDVPLHVLVNGQRLAGLDATVNVPASSETTFSRSIRLSSEGTNLIGVRANLPNDAVAADNESFAAVQVTSAVPVLLVESSNSPGPSERNLFFAELALTAPENTAPWIRARTVAADNLTVADLQDVAAIVLADVSRLPEGLPAAIHNFATAGNGVLISLGPQTTADSFDRLYQQSGLFPNLSLKRIRQHDPGVALPTTIAPYSLEAGWLNRFRERKGASFLAAPFDQWWLVELSSAASKDNGRAETAPPETSARSHKPVTVAQLTSGDPLLLQVACGQGSVLLMTSNLNADWNALPTKPDYVPFLHEALFQMAASRVARNVSFGQPLLTVVPDSLPEEQRSNLAFRAPFDRSEEALVAEAGNDQVARLPTTRLPGIYELADGTIPDSPALDSFVVNYDHSEDDPAEITEDDRSRLVVNNRLTFAESIDVLQKDMYENESRSELWALLLWLFLFFLMMEVWMTRRLVMHGHADIAANSA